MILCIGAHPDDIELGLGGLLASTSEEKVGICLTLNSGFRNMIPELVESWNILGVKRSGLREDFKHRDLERQAVLDLLIQAGKIYKPDVVFTHSSFDTHQDHKVVHEETVRAFKHKKIMGYQLPWNDVYGSRYNYYRPMHDESFANKLKVLQCYKSQSERTYFAPQYQEAIAMVNGIECGVKRAEKFEVIRWIV